MDAVRILMANGPTGGNLNDVKQIETVIAGADWVAVDAYATSLFGCGPRTSRTSPRPPSADWAPPTWTA